MPPSHITKAEQKEEIDPKLAQPGAGALTRLSRQILDATNAVLTITDPTRPDNPLIYVNEGFEQLTGYRREEALGRNCRFLQGADRDQPGAQKLREAVQKGEHVRVELRNYKKSGEAFWNELYLSPVYDDEGRLALYVGIQNDITERKTAFQASEEQLHAALDAAQMGTWDYDLKHDVVHWDGRCRELFNLPERETAALEEPLAQVHPDDRVYVEQQIAAAHHLSGDGRYHAEYRVLMPAGNRWVRATGQVHFEGSGNARRAVRSVGVVMDITERRQHEEALREMSEQLRLLVEGAKDYAIIMLDSQRRITEWNPGAERVMGYREAEVLGRRVDVVYTPEDREGGVPEREMRRASERGEAKDVRWHLRKDGTRFFANGTMTALCDDEGKLHGFAKVIQDATERKRIEEASRRGEAKQTLLLQLLQDQREASDPDAIMAAAAEAVGQYLGANRVGFFEVADSDLLAFGVSWADGELEPLAGTLPATTIGTKYLEEVRAGRTFAVADTAKDPLTEDAQFGEVGARSIVSAPIIRNGRWHAGLYVNHASVREWTAEEVALVRDVAERTWDAVERARTEAALRSSEEEYRTLFETMTQAVVYQNAEGVIISANPAARRILGLSVDELTGRVSVDPRWRALREDGSPYPGEEHPPMQALRTGRIIEDVVMAIYNSEDDAYRWLSVDSVPQFKPGEDKPYQVYSLFDDITARKEAEAERDQTQRELERANAQLYHDAFHDSLTGLPNRHLLIERLERVLMRQQRYEDHTAALLFMDFDRFKMVNDSLGHAVGDAMLKAIAERLEACIRPSDSVARLGGDEFVVLLESVAHVVEVTRVARRIKEAFDYPLKVEGHELHTSASIGIVASTASYKGAGEVLRDADIAMYRAKAQGRGSYQLFSAVMRNQAVTALQIEQELREALKRDELRVAYQPIMSATETLVGFEALVRWQHPERGLLQPGQFLPFAEEAGLLRELDFWVWREACTQVGQWQRDTLQPLTLSLNLSSQQFLHADLVDDLERLLQETGFDPANLILEITEGVLIDSSEFVKATLAELKALGLRLYLDDFGTGYSSLAYLQRFPVDALKIDRSFVMEMLDDEGSAELVRTILAMAQNLGLVAVAEGVEHRAQLTRLKELGCAYTQGFLFAKPLNQTEVVSFLAQTSLN